MKRKMTKPDKIKYALFLHMTGENATEVYIALTFTDTGKVNYNARVKKFRKYVQGNKDIAYESYQFNTRT